MLEVSLNITNFSKIILDGSSLVLRGGFGLAMTVAGTRNPSTRSGDREPSTREQPAVEGRAWLLFWLLLRLRQ